MFFKCIVCKKRKDPNKEKTIWIRHNSELNREMHHSSIHMSCLEEVIRDPDKYRLELIDECVNIVHVLKNKMEQRHQLKDKLLDEAKQINIEIFLDKSKGKNLEQGIP